MPKFEVKKGCGGLTVYRREGRYILRQCKQKELRMLYEYGHTYAITKVDDEGTKASKKPRKEPKEEFSGDFGESGRSREDSTD